MYRKTVDSADEWRRPGEQEAWHKQRYKGNVVKNSPAGIFVPNLLISSGGINFVIPAANFLFLSGLFHQISLFKNSPQKPFLS